MRMAEPLLGQPDGSRDSGCCPQWEQLAPKRNIQEAVTQGFQFRDIFNGTQLSQNIRRGCDSWVKRFRLMAVYMAVLRARSPRT